MTNLPITRLYGDYGITSGLPVIRPKTSNQRRILQEKCDGSTIKVHGLVLLAVRCAPVLAYLYNAFAEER